MQSREVSSSIRPGLALLSPAWLVALAVLLANDHWLKYADIAPGWLTGKLSDLAGMIVAPVLLAVLLRVRGRGGLLACHVAVGVVFAAIKLSPACADGWSWAMGLLGYPWTIVVDPTDLLALPFLLLSWRSLLPHMDPESSPLVPLRRSAVAGLTALGLWSSVATTESPPPAPVWSDVWGNLFLHNASDVSVNLHIRYLDARIDCEEVALDPGRILTPEAFGDAEHWQLDPGVIIGIDFGELPCSAVWVAGEGLDPTILFIDLDEYPTTWWPGFSEEYESSGPELGLATDEIGRVSWIAGEDVRFVPLSDPLDQPQACEPSPAGSRIDWSQEVPQRAGELLAIDAGLDGCFELTLQEWELQGDTPVPYETPHAWYLCSPASAMPFVIGDLIRFDEMSGGSSGTRELSLTLLDPLTLLPAIDGNQVPQRRLRLLSGGTGPQFVGPAVGRDFESVDATNCPWSIEAGCATAERVAQLREVGTTDPFPIGEPVVFSSSAIMRTMVLTHMRQRAVVDGECSEGAATLKYDIDLALVEEPG